MLKLETTYNFRNNVNDMDRTGIGSAIVNKLLKGIGMYTHYIDSRNIVEGLETIVRYYIWSEDDLKTKSDLALSEYTKIRDFLINSEFYKVLSESDKVALLRQFEDVYDSIKFLLPDIYNEYRVIREKEEEEKKQQQIVDNFLNDLDKL